MAFTDREDAGRRLAHALADYRGLHPVVLGVPRGGVPLARIVADALDGDLDVVLVCRLSAPQNPDYAIGAVDEFGNITLSDSGGYRITDPYVQAEARRQVEELHRRRQLYSPTRTPVDLEDRIVILVDDGIATGASMRAAVRTVRSHRPQQLTVAIPVASPDALVHIRRDVDRIVCLLSPVPPVAIPGFYGRFEPVSDAAVAALLVRAGANVKV